MSCSGLESQSPGCRAQQANRRPVCLLAGAIFTLEYNSDSLKVSGESGHCSVQALASNKSRLSVITIIFLNETSSPVDRISTGRRPCWELAPSQRLGWAPVSLHLHALGLCTPVGLTPSSPGFPTSSTPSLCMSFVPCLAAL